MTQRILFSLLLPLCLLLTGCPVVKKTAPDVPDGFTKYENENFSLVYPEEWAKQDGSMILFIDQDQTITKDFAVNVNVLFEAVPSGVGMDDYLDASIDGLDLMLNNPSILDRESREAANSKGRLLTYTHRVNPYTVWTYQYFTIKDGKGWILTGTAKSGEEQAAVDIFDTIIDSFYLK
ncbi:MAG: DcrB-related protein [Opitutales bacterium]